MHMILKLNNKEYNNKKTKFALLFVKIILWLYDIIHKFINKYLTDVTSLLINHLQESFIVLFCTTNTLQWVGWFCIIKNNSYNSAPLIPTIGYLTVINNPKNCVRITWF